MTIYKMEIERELRARSITKSDRVNIKVTASNKQILDYWDKILNDLLSDEHYLDYLEEEHK